MDSELVKSRRFVGAMILGIVIIGWALYTASKDGQTVDNSAVGNGVVTQSFGDNYLGDGNTDDPYVTKTDILTKNILEPYLAQVGGGTYTPESAERIVEDATTEMFKLNFTPLTIENIVTTTDTSKNGALQYKRDLYKALRPIFDLKEYELTIYARAVRDNSKEEFDSLRAIADVYRNAGNNALALSVPQDVSSVHLDIVNSLYKFSVVLQTLALGFDDPAASLAGTGNFTIAEDELRQAFVELKTYLILKEVDNITL